MDIAVDNVDIERQGAVWIVNKAHLPSLILFMDRLPS